MQAEKSLFQRPVWVAIFALTAATVWGWAYPLIKLGFAEFAITPEALPTPDGATFGAQLTGSKMLFAGVRFLISGLIILAIIALQSRRDKAVGRSAVSFALRSKSAWWFIIAYALMNTTLHYACFYFGLSHSAGSRAAILNSLSVFSVVILACIFFKSDKMTVRKVIGCIVGFAGILALNLGGDEGTPSLTAIESGEALLGDAMIIANALCSAFASLMTRGLGQRVNVVVGTGYSLAIGGALLILPGALLGGYFPQVTLMGCVILVLLIGISTIGFTLYNKLLTCNPVGKVAIYNSLIPVIGAVTSCLCLREPFYWKYVIAGALAAGGIYIINRGK